MSTQHYLSSFVNVFLGRSWIYNHLPNVSSKVQSTHDNLPSQVGDKRWHGVGQWMNTSIITLRDRRCSLIHTKNGIWEAKPYIGWPMPTHAHGYWGRCYCSWVGMGEHQFCASLHPTPNRSQLLGCMEYANQEALRAWSLRQWTTFYLSDPTKTWCRRVIHITQFLNTWAQFE
jgi:hypothetical protein